jgi:hypothetical protein
VRATSPLVSACSISTMVAAIAPGPARSGVASGTSAIWLLPPTRGTS